MKKVFRSNIKGAVFVARDRYSCIKEENIYTWSVLWGLKKEKGCIQFYFVKNRSLIKRMCETTCKKRFNDCPKEGEAWLVYPCPNGKDFWWERVDNLIDFS